MRHRSDWTWWTSRRYLRKKDSDLETYLQHCQTNILRFNHTSWKNTLTCLADNKTPLFAFPLRTETKVSLVVTEIQTTCAPQANRGDWQNLTFIANRLFEEIYLQGLALTITNLPKHNQQCGFLKHRWNASRSLWTADTSSSHLLHWDSWVVQGSYQ